MSFHLASKTLKVRENFPMLNQKMHGKPLIYFDSAATSQKPQCVIDSINNFYQNNYGTVHRAVYELSLHATNEHHDVRKKVQQFIHAKTSNEIIFTRGTTDSINLVAYSFGKAFIKPGDEVIISAMEHHSNIIPWQILCEDRQAILRVIPMNERGELILDEFKKLLNKRTKFVSLSHIANSIGTLNPIKEIIEIAHQNGAKVLIDGAQSAPHSQIDVQDFDADFFTFSGHKLFGPTGVGVLYGKEELLEQMPPYQGGGDMVERVTFEKTTYQGLPLKFEAGTPMIAEIIGLGAAIDYISSIGLEHIQAWEKSLLNYATQCLREINGLRIIGTAKDKGSIISFIVEGTHPLDIGTLLDLQGVAVRTGHHCAQPVMQHFGISSTVRLSFAFYNTLEEIDQFIVALKHVLKSLR